MADDDFGGRESILDTFARQEGLKKGQDVQVIPPSTMRPNTGAFMGAVQVAVRRDETAVLQKLAVLASAAGSDWYYRFPVKNKKENRTDYIEGPSIKLANDLARLYGNCEIDCDVIDLGDHWMIYAVFTDYETGYRLKRPFQQRKNQRSVGGDRQDMADRALDIALQIGASKAIRNVTTNALQTFSDFAFQEAKNALVEKVGKDLPRWRERVAQRLEDLKVEPLRVEKIIGRKLADMLAPDVAKVIAMMQAVRDGMATLEETFPPLATEGVAEGEAVDPKTGEVTGQPAKASELDKFAEGAQGEKGEGAKPAAAKDTAAGKVPPPAAEGAEAKKAAPLPKASAPASDDIFPGDRPNPPAEGRAAPKGGQRKG